METPEQPQKSVVQPVIAQPVAPQQSVTATKPAAAPQQQPVASNPPATYSMPAVSSPATGERSPATGESSGSAVKKIMAMVIVVAVLGGGIALGYFVFPETFYNTVGKYIGMSAPSGAEEVSSDVGEEDATSVDENENAVVGEDTAATGESEPTSELEPESDAEPGQEDKSDQPLTEAEQAEYQRIFDEQERQLNEGEPLEPAELEDQAAEPSNEGLDTTLSRPKIRRPQAQ